MRLFSATAAATIYSCCCCNPLKKLTRACSYTLYSWGIDGTRVSRWHDGDSDWGKRWTEGDVIGCAADLVNNKILFSINGNWQAPMGCAFDRGQVTAKKIGTGVFPAISARDMTIRANFGERAWRYGPPDDSFVN
jgi:hypothetical protein